MEEKKYTEEEIFTKIDEWINECDKLFERSDINNLKSKFMTPQGFRKAIEKADLVGTKF